MTTIHHNGGGVFQLSYVKPIGTSDVAHKTLYTYNYDDLVKITGKDYASIKQDKSRKLFDPENLESIVVYLARHARPEVRQRMFDFSAAHGPLPERPGPSKRPRRTTKTGKRKRT